MHGNDTGTKQHDFNVKEKRGLVKGAIFMTAILPCLKKY
jgi:hypothetical protein